MKLASRAALAAFAVTFVFGLSLASGCGSSTPTTTSVQVPASKGGVVAAPGDKGKLTIPANALGADTTITLALSPAASDTVTEIFDFGPSGTTFSTPATLEIAADASKLATGKSFALAVQEGTTWKPIAGSTYANGKVSGPVAHFSKFTVVLVDGNVVVMSDCANEIAAFQACGGDIVGTWSYENYCFNSKVLGSDPFRGQCPGFMGSLNLNIAGDITVTATTTQVSATTITFETDWSIPTSCFSLDAGFYTSCAQVQQVLAKSDGGCTDTGSSCNCKQTSSQSQDAGEVKPRDNDGGMGEYCVKNGKLYISDLKPDGGGALIILKKK